jgi:hypothetical protein
MVSKELSWILPPLMFVAGLILLGSDPANGVGSLLSGYVLMVAVTVWMYLRFRNSQDEVIRTANVVAMSFGAPVGLGLAFVSIFFLRYLPPVTHFVADLADRSDPSLGPAAAAFSMGILFTCAIVVLCSCVSWAGWWLAKR